MVHCAIFQGGAMVHQHSVNRNLDLKYQADGLGRTTRRSLCGAEFSQVILADH